MSKFHSCLKTTYSEDLAKISQENESYQRRIQDLEDQFKSQNKEITSMKSENVSLHQKISTKNSE